MTPVSVLQSYWTSDGLPLYCSQPTGEKTHTNQQCERLTKIRQTTGNIHEAETGSRLTNGSCAMSLNSNHIVLSTMPSVIVDVGLLTVDV
jgi:hypothetical protein